MQNQGAGRSVRLRGYNENLHYNKFSVSQIYSIKLVLGADMTLFEIERAFLDFTNQLESLKDKYPNPEMMQHIDNLMTDTQIIKLKVMRLDSVKGQDQQHLSQSVVCHISKLQTQITALKQSFEIITFNA